VISKTYYQGI